MARFGRGQPHAPIFLRAPLVAAALALAPQINVVLAPPASPAARRSHVYRLRNPVVPSAIGESRITIVHGRIKARHASRDAHVITLRNLVVDSAAAPAVRNHVITPVRLKRPTTDVVVLRAPKAPFAIGESRATIVHGRIKARHAARDAHVYQLRNPAAPATAAPVVRSHVVLAPRRARERTATHVLALRAPVPVVEQAGIPITVVHTAQRRRLPTDVIQLRTRVELAAVGESRITVIHGRIRARHAARDAKIVQLRGAAAAQVFEAPATSRIHVVQPYRLKRPDTSVAVLRAPDIPPAAAPAVRIHVVQVRRAPTRGKVIVLRAPTFIAQGKSGIAVVHARKLAKHPARDAKIIQLRAPSIPQVFEAPANTRVHVVAPYRLKKPATHVILVRNPQAQVFEPPAVRIHVIFPYRLPRPTVHVTSRRAHLQDPPPPPPTNLLQFRYDP